MARRAQGTAAREKEFTRLRDRLSAERRALPWVKVDKTYVFDAPEGKVTLADLFGKRSQLVIKHFMFGPDWSEGCVGCSFELDHTQGALVHLAHHDVTYVVVVARAAGQDRAVPAAHGLGRQLGVVVRQRLQLRLPRVVHARTNRRRHGLPTTIGTAPAWLDEMSGRSVFFKDAAGQIFHTYSSFARGGEMFLGSYAFLDIMPKGRDETVNGNLTDWVRHHDRYDDGAASCCHGD